MSRVHCGCRGGIAIAKKSSTVRFWFLKTAKLILLTEAELGKWEEADGWLKELHRRSNDCRRGNRAAITAGH